MKKLKITVAVLALLLISTKVIASDSFSTPEMTNEQYVKSLVYLYAKEYGVSASSMIDTIKQEDNTFDFTIQSGLKYKKGNRWGFPKGTREKSYGIAQIHLPDHPEITYEQAINPDFAVAFMAKEFSEGHQRKWSAYRT